MRLNKRLNTASIALALYLTSSWMPNASAQTIAIFSFDDASCGTWIKASRKLEDREPYLHWIRGFVSGFNAGNPSRTVPLDAMPNQETLALYLDKHCRENPLDSFYVAAFRLANTISQPTRTKK